MATTTTPSTIRSVSGEIAYPTSDGRTMGETDLHRDVMVSAIESLKLFYAGQRVYVSGNILLCYRPGDRRRHVSPDVLVVKGVEQRDRENYLVWEEGQAPHVVIEVTSRSTRKKTSTTNSGSTVMRWGWPSISCSIHVKNTSLRPSRAIGSPTVSMRRSNQSRDVCPCGVGLAPGTVRDAVAVLRPAARPLAANPGRGPRHGGSRAAAGGSRSRTPAARAGRTPPRTGTRSNRRATERWVTRERRPGSFTGRQGRQPNATYRSVEVVRSRGWLDLVKTSTIFDNFRVAEVARLPGFPNSCECG